MKLFRITILALVAMSFLILGSCKKATTDSPQAADVDNTNLLTERIFTDVGNLALKALSGTGASLKVGQIYKSSETGCTTVTFDLTAQPYTMTIDFGSTNCPGTDLVNRRGKIIATITGQTADSSNVLTINFDNFFVNDNQVTGTRTMANRGHNQAGHKNWDVTVTNGSVILANNGGTITYEASHNNELIAGGGTLAFGDDVYSITGSSSGTTLAGKTYSAVITTPVISNMTCAYFVSGVVELTPADGVVRTLNYGNGDCDNQATLTVGGVSFSILLPY